MNGIFTILDHKKWVFAYFISGMSFWRLDGSEIMAVLIALIPVTLGASSFDKSVWRKDQP